MGAASPATATTTWGLLAAIAAIAWTVGAPLPMAWGWLPALLVALVTAGLVRARLGAAGLGGWHLALRPRPAVTRGAVVLATGFAAVVFAAVLAGAVAQLLMAFPGATLAVVIVGVAVVAMDRIEPLGKGRLAWVLAPVIVGLAVIGARFEAEGEGARGRAYTGPILGIHPFQSTAIVVDGYGPFDLPINDFVEPTGGRGYDPPALAKAIELALHRIAEVHFADGPLRAREAFAGAKVEHTTTPAVRERLDTEVAQGAVDPRLVIHSGTTGQRSRVEFVCPGRRDDPRGAKPEAVMTRACPTKYASEASAGLGVTGRWPGYGEVRGSERTSIAHLLGITREHGAAGTPWRARERWLYATVVLAVVLAAATMRGGAPARSTIACAAPIAAPLVALVLVAAFASNDLGSLAATATAPPWMRLLDLDTWMGALVWPAAAAMLAWSVPQPGAAPPRVRLAVVVLALVGVWLASTDLDAAQWSPAWWNATAPVEQAVLGFADAIARALGLPILETESIVAAALAAPMVVGIVVVVRGAAIAAQAARTGGQGEPSDRRIAMVVAALVVVLAVLLGLSRKTSGGVALIPAATGVALVLGSALRRIASRGIWPRAHVSFLAIAVHLAWVATGLVLVVRSMPTQGGDPVRWIYFAIALAAALLPATACLADPEAPAGPGGRAPDRPA
jgi:hypothetical protein